MDPEVAAWIAGFLVDARSEVSQCPAVTIEVEGRTGCWIQVILEPADNDDDALARYTLNFPFRGHHDEPLDLLARVVRPAPPGSRTVDYEPDGFATIALQPDIPPLALTLFAGEILERLLDAGTDAEYLIEISTQNC